MKNPFRLKCFDITEAVKDGIEDFNRLSGYASKKSKVIVPVKKATGRLLVKFIPVAIITLLAKIIK